MSRFSRLSTVPVLACLALAVPLMACDKKEDKAEEEIVKLDKASNGAPVSIEVYEFIGEGEERGMKVRLYNWGDKASAGGTILFRYFDTEGKPLKVKPGTAFEKDTDFTSVSGGKYGCKPGENATFEIDGRMVSVPPEAVRAEALMSKVSAIAADGNTIEDWFSQDDFTEWPAG